MRKFYIFVFYCFCLFITSSITSSTAQGNDGCNETGNWTVYGGQCYSCMNDQISWQSARSSCSQLGGHLVTISNLGIQNFLQDLCTNTNYWIGLNDRSNETIFVWDDKSMPVSYSNWASGEPNDAGNEDCVHLSVNTYQWNDEQCETNLSYICQTMQDIDDCQSEPCQNNGTCYDMFNDYHCNCVPGYNGTNCEKDIDECAFEPCNNNGNCIDLINDYQCDCADGFNGTNCTNVTTVRLVGGATKYEGRLEVFYNGVWGTVCDDYMNNEVAAVVCRSLGLPWHTPVAYCCARYGMGSSRIWLDDVRCNGSETRLEECSHSDWGVNNCGHQEDLSITCLSVENLDSTVRLVEGASNYEGRLEVFHNGAWGTVCDDITNNELAAVVCRSLGLPWNTSVAYCCAIYGMGSSQIWLDDVHCNGSETRIEECSHNNWGIHNCGHQEDVSIKCLSDDITTVRLVGGATKYEGRLEVFHNGTWGTVCDDIANNELAAVVCRSLGLPWNTSVAYCCARYGMGSSQIWLDDVHCNGAERRIEECSHNKWGDNNCIHYEDISINCLPAEITNPITQVQKTTTQSSNTTTTEILISTTKPEVLTTAIQKVSTATITSQPSTTTSQSSTTTSQSSTTTSQPSTTMSQPSTTTSQPSTSTSLSSTTTSQSSTTTSQPSTTTTSQPSTMTTTRKSPITTRTSGAITTTTLEISSNTRQPDLSTSATTRGAPIASTTSEAITSTTPDPSTSTTTRKIPITTTLSRAITTTTLGAISKTTSPYLSTTTRTQKNPFTTTTSGSITTTTLEVSNIDECLPNPCQNNGTCINLVNDFKCNCVAEFNGTTCENNIGHHCAPSPCKNNGTCIELINGFQCQCPLEFTGTTCSIGIICFLPKNDALLYIFHSHFFICTCKCLNKLHI